jgi:SulP family sulfate permease
VPSHYRALVLDFTDVPFADATGANMIAGVCRTAARNGARVFLTGAADDLRDAMIAHGVQPPAVRFAANVEEAIAVFKRPG